MAASTRLTAVAEQLAREGYAAQTVKNYLSSIRLAQRWCEERGYSLLNVPVVDVAEFLAGCDVTKPIALEHYWRICGRSDNPLPLARRRLAERRREVNLTGLTPAAGERVMAAVSKLERDGLSARTVRIYALEMRRAERWFEAADISLLTATAAEIGDYVALRPRSNATYQLVRVALGHYWTVHKHPDPPLWAIRVPKKARMTCKALSEEEAEVLARHARLLALHGHRRGLAVLLGLYQGLRREEIATAMWSDFAEGHLTTVGKGDVTRRNPVHQVVAAAVLTVERRDPEWVFVGRRGSHVSPATVWQWVRQIADEAGVTRRIRPHHLRHTCLAVANDATGDLRAVQDFAGHAKPETTAGYTRTLARRLQDVVNSVRYGGEDDAQRSSKDLGASTPLCATPPETAGGWPRDLEGQDVTQKIRSRPGAVAR